MIITMNRLERLRKRIERNLASSVAKIQRKAEKEQIAADEELIRLQKKADRIKMRSDVSRAEAERRLETVRQKSAENLARIESKLAPKIKNVDSEPKTDEVLAAERAAKKRSRSGKSMYDLFAESSFVDIESLLQEAETREEKAFYRQVLNLKLQIEQEKVIGEVLY